jgi:hypothetical protein
MSNRYQGGFLTASYNGLKVPDAPTIGTASVASGTSVSLTFTAPANVGGGAITGYTAISSPGGITGTGTSSPITISGLTTGTAYTFTVVATNAYGTGLASAASNSVTPLVIGQQAYTSAGTYSWVAPSGVTSVSVVAVGTGGGVSGGNNSAGGGGGALAYANNLSVSSGNSYTVIVGAVNITGDGGDSSFNSTCVKAGGGKRANVCYNGSAGVGGQVIYGTGGAGGYGGCQYGGSAANAGGGGAGGYSGAGGRGGWSGSAGADGTGGGGGGGGPGTGSGGTGGGGGGGVGILGQGSNGAGGTSGCKGGKAGSSGGNGASGYPGGAGCGGLYGGGNGAVYYGSNGSPGVGAVRIIWPGNTRSFPSTNTGNL